MDADSLTLVSEIWMLSMAAVGPGQVVSEEGLGLWDVGLLSMGPPGQMEGGETVEPEGGRPPTPPPSCLHSRPLEEQSGSIGSVVE